VQVSRGGCHPRPSDPLRLDSLRTARRASPSNGVMWVARFPEYRGLGVRAKKPDPPLPDGRARGDGGGPPRPWTDRYAQFSKPARIGWGPCGPARPVAQNAHPHLPATIDGPARSRGLPWPTSFRPGAAGPSLERLMGGRFTKPASNAHNLPRASVLRSEEYTWRWMIGPAVRPLDLVACQGEAVAGFTRFPSRPQRSSSWPSPLVSQAP